MARWGGLVTAAGLAVCLGGCDSDAVPVAAPADGGVAPGGDAPPAIVASQGRLEEFTSLVLTGDQVFVVASGFDSSVERVSKRGGPLDEVAFIAQGTVSNLTVGSTHVFWATERVPGDGSTIYRAPVTGSGQPEMQVLPEARPQLTAASGDALYLGGPVSALNATGTNGLWKLDRFGQPPTLLYQHPGRFTRLMVDDSSIYFVSEGPSPGGSLVRLTRDPAADEQPVSLYSFPSYVIAVVSDADAFYFVDEAGSLSRLVKGGSEPVVLGVDTYPRGFALALDDSFVYLAGPLAMWTGGSCGGHIARIAKLGVSQASKPAARRRWHQRAHLRQGRG